MKTEKDGREQLAGFSATPAMLVTGGDMALAVALIEKGVVTHEVVNPLLNRLRTERAAAIRSGQTLALLQLVANEQLAKLDDLLAFVVERSGLPYLPLATYDVDRDIACLVPAEIAFEFCLIPFDKISRYVLVAIANPLDTAICDRVRALIGCDLFWYVSSPVDITNALRRAHGLDQPPGSGKSKA